METQSAEVLHERPRRRDKRHRPGRRLLPDRAGCGEKSLSAQPRW